VLLYGKGTANSVRQTYMAWFKRQKANILTDLSEQNESPEGQWVKCPGCSEIVNSRELNDNLLVCPKCGHHFTMSSLGYFQLLFDEGAFTLHDHDLRSVDALHFTDGKPYTQRLQSAQRKTGLSDAARAASGHVGGCPLSAAALDFSFIGGSMGSVVGEVVTRAIKRACDERTPLLIISQSGGARMMEGALSLMQMAKTSAYLTRLADLGLPYFSLMTNPTTGGVTASFAMLGDFNLAEPGALIGFAGPRVIRETIGSDLPGDFQRAEFLVEHGFVDFIVSRKELRKKLIQLLGLILAD
jgi:acetyl-CoA carboxylase carboxyl transferase subunit beta